MSKKVIWFVNHGIDITHLWDTCMFNTLKEARQFIATMPESYLGPRAYEIHKYDYSDCHIYGNVVRTTFVESRG